ncbi:DNA damage-binding protein 1a [Orobanche gracilis]
MRWMLYRIERDSQKLRGYLTLYIRRPIYGIDRNSLQLHFLLLLDPSFPSFTVFSSLVIPFDDKGQIDVVIVISLSSITHSWIGDVVFLHDSSSSSPIIAVLYQDESDDMDCYVATRTVSLEDKIFNPGPWSVRRVFHAAESLIPIPYPICGVLVIGNNQIMYRCGEELISTAVEQFVPSANGIFSVDGSRYLLGNEKGKIYKLDIICELGMSLFPPDREPMFSLLDNAHETKFSKASAYALQLTFSLLCKKVERKVRDICLLNSADFPNGLAIAEYSRLHGSSIVSCSFSTDNSTYYCVGTSCREDQEEAQDEDDAQDKDDDKDQDDAQNEDDDEAQDEEREKHHGRILVLSVNDRKPKLKLISEIKTRKAVTALSNFNGKLLAGVGSKIHVYKWDGSRQLNFECSYKHDVSFISLQARDDTILAIDEYGRRLVLKYKHEGTIDYAIGQADILDRATCSEFVDNENFLFGSEDYLFALSRDGVLVSSERIRPSLKDIGEFGLGDVARRLRYNSNGKIPSILFGTSSGGIPPKYATNQRRPRIPPKYSPFTRLLEHARGLERSTTGTSTTAAHAH